MNGLTLLHNLWVVLGLDLKRDTFLPQNTLSHYFGNEQSPYLAKISVFESMV